VGLLAGSEGSRGTAASEVKLEEADGKEARAGSRSGLRGVAAGSDAGTEAEEAGGGGMGEAEDLEEEMGRNGLVA
jgi:hypothetical protein